MSRVTTSTTTNPAPYALLLLVLRLLLLLVLLLLPSITAAACFADFFLQRRWPPGRPRSNMTIAIAENKGFGKNHVHDIV